MYDVEGKLHHTTPDSRCMVLYLTHASLGAHVKQQWDCMIGVETQLAKNERT